MLTYVGGCSSVLLCYFLHVLSFDSTSFSRLSSNHLPSVSMVNIQVVLLRKSGQPNSELCVCLVARPGRVSSPSLAPIGKQ